MEGAAKLLNDMASEIVDDAENDGGRLVTKFLAPRLVRRVFPQGGTGLQEHQSYCDSVQRVGAVLRRKYGDGKDPIGAQHKEQFEFAEFGSKLQDKYPVEITLEDGEVFNEYKPREELSEIEIAALCKKMQQIGDAYYAHADQLLRWFKSR